MCLMSDKNEHKKQTGDKIIKDSKFQLSDIDWVCNDDCKMKQLTIV